MKRAFSLVELSIVLVILGLLTGGILAGQSLIRAAELRSVTTDYQRYMTSLQGFRDKYLALPGDMSNATRFWGRLNSNGDCVTNSSAVVSAPGTCDGNADGVINWATANGQSAEMYQSWRQLANAGLMEGSYSGLSGAGGVAESLIGTNVPRARLNNAGYTIYPVMGGSIPIGNPLWFEGTYSANVLVFGLQNAATVTEGAAIKPDEAWNIDMKMDDGRPGLGNVRAYEGYTQCQDAGSSVSVALANSANYLLTSTTVACNLIFLIR